MAPPCLPNAAETLLLRAALLDREPALAAFATWRENLDFDALSLGAQRVLAQLYSNLSALGIDDPLMGRLRGIARYAWVSNHRTVLLTQPLMTALDTAGIPAMRLAGLAITAALPSQMALRPIGDIDLLVPPQHAGAAMDIAAAHGWRPTYGTLEYAKHQVSNEQHCLGFEQHPHFVLNLHWFMLDACRWPSADAAPWSRAADARETAAGQPEATQGANAGRTASLEDQLLLACLRGVRWSPVETLRWAADAVLLLRAAGPRFDWRYFLAECRRRHVAFTVHQALAYLHAQLEVPVPADILQDFQCIRGSFSTRLECRLRGTSPYVLSDRQSQFLAFQTFRRTEERLAGQRTMLAVCAWLKSRWKVDSCLTAAALTAFAMIARPPWLRRLALRFWPRDPRRAVIDIQRLPIIAEGRIDLSVRGAASSGILYGWSRPERDGRWTVGGEAALVFRAGTQPHDLEVAITLLGLVTPAVSSMRIEFWANQHRLPDWHFAPGVHRHVMRIPASALSTGYLVLTLVIRYPHSPQDLGLSADRRQLGVFVRTITFSPAAAPMEHADGGY